MKNRCHISRRIKAVRRVSKRGFDNNYMCKCMSTYVCGRKEAESDKEKATKRHHGQTSFCFSFSWLSCKKLKIYKF